MLLKQYHKALIIYILRAIMLSIKCKLHYLIKDKILKKIEKSPYSITDNSKTQSAVGSQQSAVGSRQSAVNS